MKKVILLLLTVLISQPAYAQVKLNQASTDTLKPDYRNHINLPEYNPALMPINRQTTGTEVWTELNPKVPRVDYYGIYLKDQLSCFAVGEFGAIIKTTDGGQSWIDKSFPTNSTLLRISGKQNLIFAVGVQGLILRSIDFGETWNLVDVQVSADIWGVHTFNDSTCFICSKDGKLFKTYDSGLNWQTIEIGYPFLYWDMQFMDQDTGFISCSDGKILKTTNAGNTWEIKETGDLYSIYKIEILPNNNLVVAGQSGQIYYSTDFGNTFIQSIVPINFIIEDIGFVNDDIGIVIGQATVTNAILKTTNGGLNWNLINQQMGHLNVDFISDSVGFNVGMDLNIYKTTDTGETWGHTILNDDFYDSEFLTEKIGFVCSGALYKSFNAGKTWEKLPNGTGGYYIDFIDSLIGFIGSNNATINKTSNGGNNWYNTNYILNAGQIKKINFIGFNKGWALANSLYKTSDNGETWAQILTIINPNNFYFIDSLNGWIAALNNIYSTIDGGASWEVINTSFSFNDIAFKDINTGYGANGLLYKTTDSGSTWQVVSGATGNKLQLVDSAMIVTWGNDGDVFISKDEGINWQQYNLPNRNSIKFFDKTNGYLVGEMGLIYSFQDTSIVPVELINFEANVHGNQIILKWSTASELNNVGFEIQKKTNNNDWYVIGFAEGNGTTTNLNNYSFIDANPVDGKNYYRLKQNDYNGSYSYTKIVQIDFIQPNDFKLIGNYPNPFNSQTNIICNLPYVGDVELKVFDVLGREIDKLSYKNLKAGINKISYSMLKLSSGVYFYSIVNENKKLLGKLMLLK